MATFLEVNQWASEPQFQSRVRSAMVKSAIAIVGEPMGSMTLKQTTKRQIMASAILNGAAAWFGWSLAVMSNAAVQAAGVTGDPPTSAAPDGDIEFTVNSIWDDMSGVTTEDLIQ